MTNTILINTSLHRKFDVNDLKRYGLKVKFRENTLKLIHKPTLIACFEDPTSFFNIKYHV